MLFKNQKHNTMTQNLKKGSARKPKAAKRKTTNWLHFKLRCMHTSWLAWFESHAFSMSSRDLFAWYIIYVYFLVEVTGARRSVTENGQNGKTSAENT